MGSSKGFQRAAAVFGALFVAALVVIAIFLPNPTPFAYTVFRIVLALAAAGVAAMIPGFLRVEVGRAIRSGGAIAVFVLVYFFNPKPPQWSAPDHDGARVLAVAAQIWNVEADAKGSLVAATEVTGRPGEGITDLELDELVQWIAEQLIVSTHVDAVSEEEAPIRVTVHIPADLRREEPTITRVPPGPLDVHAWYLGESGKVRFPIDPQGFRNMNREFSLELNVPGYGSATLAIVPGSAIDTSLSFETSAKTTSVGVEPFAGDEADVGPRLAQRLSTHSAFKVVDPERLTILREQLRQQREEIERNPQTQQLLRMALGVEYLVAGGVEVRSGQRK